ncbi:MAG: cation transporter [Firmicutes bacterium]|nr:cation transporter [Bacillota bacterium]
MKKKFNVVDVCCGNCAAKMEAEIKKIEGVIDAKLNFLTQKLVIEADEDKMDEIAKQASACMSKIDADAHLEL